MHRDLQHCAGLMTKTSPKKKKCKKAKGFSERLYRKMRKKRSKRLGEKGKIHPSEFQRIGRRDKKAILKEQ